MKQRDKDAIADVLMSLTMLEAAIVEMQEIINREREILRADIESQ